MLIILAFIGAIVMSLSAKKKNAQFKEFLNANAYSILNGYGCEYRGRIYTKDTKIASFKYCVSTVIMTRTRRTFYVHSDEAGVFRMIAFLITLFTGWWGFPWGPIKTIETLTDIFKDTNTITVAELYRHTISVMCPECGNVFEADIDTGTVICPHCKSRYRVINNSGVGISLKKENISFEIGIEKALIACLIAIVVMTVVFLIIFV